MGSYEFAEYFRKNGIFCGRTEASAPTVFLESFGKFVGVDTHIDPEGSYEFAEDFRKIRFICRDDVGIVPYA